MEDPTYIKENNLQIDYLEYIETQIKKPCLSFLELICNNPDDIFKNIIKYETSRRKGVLPINKYFDMNDSITENINEEENLFDNVINQPIKKLLPETKKPIRKTTKLKDKPNSKTYIIEI